MNPTLSIIVPMYNVEQYIIRCIDSLISNGDDSYEVILVDDGSPDKSYEIAKTRIEGFSNFSIIRQGNRGLSEARNSGFRKAKGEFVWFVDSDDWIEPNAIQFIIETIKSNPDVDFITIAGRNSNTTTLRNVLPKTTDPHQILLGNWSPCTVFNICRMEFLRQHKLEFLPGVFHEDCEFTPRVMFYAKKCLVTNKHLYNVFINPNSITRTYNPQKSFDLIVIAKRLYNFANQHISADDTKMQSAFASTIMLLLNSALHNIQNFNRDKKHEFNEELSRHRQLFYFAQKSSKLKYRIESRILSLPFIHNFSSVYSWMKL